MRYLKHHPWCNLEKQRDEDAGYDLNAACDTVVEPLASEVIPLGISVAIPNGQYGLLTHRSSLAFKRNGVMSLGIIDSNFRGEMKAKVFNTSPHHELRIKQGERIAQLIIHEYISPELEEVKEMEDGKGGFGSSGV